MGTEKNFVTLRRLMERSWYSLIDAESGVCCDVILKGIAKSLVTANGFKI